MAVKKTIRSATILSYNHLYHNALFGNIILESGVKSLIRRRVPTQLGDREEGDRGTTPDGETSLLMGTGDFSCQYRFCKKPETRNSDERLAIIPGAVIFTGWFQT